MTQLQQGFMIGVGGVMILLGLYMLGMSAYILWQRFHHHDRFAPTEYAAVALPFGLIAVVLGSLMLYVGIR